MSRLVLRLGIFLVLLLLALRVVFFGSSFAGGIWDLLAVEIDFQLPFAQKIQRLVLHALCDNSPKWGLDLFDLSILL